MVSDYTPPPVTQATLKGAPYVTVSPVGLAQGYPKNNNANYGPDTPGTKTSGIQEAVDVAIASSLGVYLRSGIYSISSGISITSPVDIVGESGEMLTGKVNAGVMLTATMTMPSMVNVDYSATEDATLTGGQMSRITLNGNGKAVVGLLVTRAIRSVFSRVTVFGCTGWGLQDLYNHSHTFGDCTFSLNGTNGTGTPPASGGATFGNGGTSTVLNLVKFNRCTFESNNECGAYFDECNSIRFTSCLFQANYSYGVYGGGVAPHNSSNCTFDSCWFEGNQQNGNNQDANVIQSPSATGYFFDTCYWNESAATIGYALKLLAASSGIIAPTITGTNKLWATGLFIGSTANLDVGDSISPNTRILPFAVNEFGVTTPALPAGTGSANFKQNLNATAVIVYLPFSASGTAFGVTVVDFSGNVVALPSDPASVYLAPGDKIYFATTVPATWKWYET